jgi:hypothetical protein
MRSEIAANGTAGPGLPSSQLMRHRERAPKTTESTRISVTNEAHRSTRSAPFVIRGLSGRGMCSVCPDRSTGTRHPAAAMGANDCTQQLHSTPERASVRARATERLPLPSFCRAASVARGRHSGQTGAVTSRTTNKAWWLEPRNQLLLLVSAVIVIAVAVAVIAQGKPPLNTLEYEARRYAIQFLLLTGLGAVLAFLIDLERRTREARQQRRTFDIETASRMLNELDEIYASVKNTRRMLRVDQAFGELDVARLRERMFGVNQAQTRAERLAKQMIALDPPVVGLAAAAAHVKLCDDYLSRLWDKYEDAPAPGPWLEPFVASHRDPISDFKPTFQKHYNEARKCLAPLLGEVSTKAR